MNNWCEKVKKIDCYFKFLPHIGKSPTICIEVEICFDILLKNGRFITDVPGCWDCRYPRIMEGNALIEEEFNEEEIFEIQNSLCDNFYNGTELNSTLKQLTDIIEETKLDCTIDEREAKRRGIIRNLEEHSPV